MALFGSIATVKAQLGSAERFAAAWAYLDEVLRVGTPAQLRARSVAVGETRRIELAGGAFALEQAFETKARAQGFFESHRNYIDVQVVLEGTERMELVDLARAGAATPYDATKDLIKYADAPDVSALTVRPGEAAVFFPADVHMPGLAPGAGVGRVWKTVVKVPVG